MPLTPGTRLGVYDITAQIGVGGMGEVYRARDTRLQRDIAIKVLPELVANDADRLIRFEHEARTASSLNHPNILTIYEIGEASGVRFIASELVVGETLRTRLARGSMPVEDAIRVTAQMATGLATAHEAGIVHRDVKPENVMIRPDGLVKLLDFGLAKLTRVEDASATMAVGHSASGMISGTTKYMSPEQARGLPLDARSDVFSVGVVLYEMLAGRPPFDGPTMTDVMVAILERPPSAWPLSREIASPEVQRVLSRCLEKDAARRYASARELLADLQPTRPDSSPTRAAASPPPSIAVLPFADMSSQKDQDFFCEGMAEELINALAKLPGLQVASRTSAFRFKGAEDIRKIGEQLGVATVLEGGVRTAGKRLRVTAQLIKVADGYHLWSERYDRNVEDIFDIQDEIALAIVSALKVRLLDDQQAELVKRQTDNVDAYQLCLKARYHWHRWTEDALRKATDLFEQARQIDPNYALAHFGLGDCLAAATAVGVCDPDTPGKTRALFERAIQLDPSLAEAHALLGIVQGCYEWNWAPAMDHMQNALRLNPRSAHVHAAHAHLLVGTGRLSDARKAFVRALELDPLAPIWNAHYAEALYASRESLESIRQAEATIDIEPRMWLADAVAGLSRVAVGDAAAAIAPLERSVQHSGRLSYALGWLGFGLAKAGRRDDAEGVLRELADRFAGGLAKPLSIAFVQVGLGRLDDGLIWIERAADVTDPNLYFHIHFPAFDDVRTDPRFERVRQRVQEPR